MKTTIKNVEKLIAKHALIPEGSSIIVGLSGGPDSVFLLHYLNQLKQEGIISDLIAAHLNHGWRESASNDEQFCKKMCDDLGIPFVAGHLSEFEPAIKTTGSQEDLGRKARRLFLEKVRQEHNADLIALAHHLQDQEETFFIRLVRGTSLTGLTCMWPKSGHYIRPLLEVNKNDIVDYLKEHNIPYCTDPTNIDPKFLRNRIRALVLPPLRACDKRFDHNFLSTLNRLQATEQYLDQVTQTLYSSMHSDQGLNLSLFFEQPLIMQYRILLLWLCAHKVPFIPTNAFLDEILRFLKQPGSKTHEIHESWKIIKQKSYARIDSR